MKERQPSLNPGRFRVTAEEEEPVDEDSIDL